MLVFEVGAGYSTFYAILGGGVSFRHPPLIMTTWHAQTLSNASIHYPTSLQLPRKAKLSLGPSIHSMPPHLHLTHHHCGHHPTTVLKMPTSCTHVTVIHHCWAWTHCIMLQTHHSMDFQPSYGRLVYLSKRSYSRRTQLDRSLVLQCLIK